MFVGTLIGGINCDISELPASCSHSPAFLPNFELNPYIALKWTWWLRASLRVHDPTVVGIYSEPGANLYTISCKLPQLAL